MKTPSRPLATLGYFKFLILIGVFALGMAAFAAPFYTARSHALPQSPPSPPIDNASNQSSSRFGINFLLPQAGSPAIATFEATCQTADSDFNIGQTVCARATSTGGSASGRRITWSDPQGFIRKSTVITEDPQEDTFEIPNESTTVLSNGQEVGNIGKWRVNIVTRRGALVTFAQFLVKDPAQGRADLAIFKRAPGNAQQPTPGSVSTFQIYIENYGPDDAQNVVVTDRVPSNTTFVAMLQTSATPTPGFTCDTVPDANGDVRCTISSLAFGATATFDVAFTIDNGAAPGTVITNTATISSATSDGIAEDNSSSATITVAGGGGAGTCTLDCPPNINTQADTTDANNNPGAVVHFDQPTTEGACGTITADHCNDCFFPVGTTVVTFSSTTGDSCSFAVTVSPPNPGGAVTISCPGNQSTTANSSCEATVAVGTATATGSNVTVFGSRSDGKPMYDCDENGNCTRRNTDAPFAAGTTTITWIAYSHDVAGPYTTPGPNPGDTFEEQHRTGSASCTQTIVVTDVTAPVIAAEDETIAADANCQAVVPDYISTVSDNCACASSDTSQGCEDRTDFTYTQTPAAGTVVGPGEHEVTITANDGSSNNDGAGNQTTKTITLTVVDQTDPTISCPANITQNTDTGQCTAIVNPGTATATDSCDSSVTISGTRSDNQPLNAPYPKGTTTITWTATDDAGNSSECEQTVTVEDNEDPVIVCPAPTTASADASCEAAIPDRRSEATTSDNCGDVTVTQSPEPGTMVGLGTHTITLTATDSSGNTSSCETTFTVVDTTAPVITVTSQTLTMWPPNHKYKTFLMSDLVTGVSDNCSTLNTGNVVIVSVSSDEPENAGGDGNTNNDIVIAADCKSIQLRAERAGSGDGRVYTINVVTKDQAGNVGAASIKVRVPKTGPNGTAVDSGPNYIVNGTCPP